MKLIRSLVPLCALLLPCALSAETFEGKVAMTMTMASAKDGPQAINYSIKEGLMRLDVTGGKGGGGFIMDYKNKQMTILMPQQQMYMVRPMSDTGGLQKPAGMGPTHPAGAASDTSFKDTGQKETILGYVCEKYEVTTAKGTTDIWATDQLGTFGGLSMGGGPGGRHSQAAQEWEKVIKGSSFFPLRVVGNEGGSQKFKLEVTSIDKQTLPDSVFLPPDGWRKLDLGGVMGGMFQGGFPGAKPADGNN
jgi:Domain of unknown function (DUF4412)